MSQLTNHQNDRLPPIIEHVPAVILRLSHTEEHWRTHFVTQNVSEYGYTADDFLSGRVRWMDIVHPDDRVLVSKTISDYEAHHINSFRLYYRLVTKSGESLPVTEYNTVNRDENGAILCYDTAIVTRQTQNEDDRRLIDHHYRQQVVLNDILLSLHDTDLDHALQIILDRTGAYLDTSRALLFKDSPDYKTCKIVYEWCNVDIPSVMDLDYSITYETGMPEIYIALQTTGLFLINFGEIPENCKEEFEAEGLIASAIFAVYLNGEHYGFVCFDDCVIERRWDEDTARFLKNVSNLISTVLARQATALQLEQNQKTYEAVLDNIDAYIFVANPEDHRIIFANQAFGEAFGTACVGMKAEDCIDMDFGGLTCEQLLALAKNPENSAPDLHSEKAGKWLNVAAEEITWVDGQRVCLVTCYDTTTQKLYADAMEKMAYLDHLTGLPNRYRCEVDLDRAIGDAVSAGKNGYLLFIDMDDFKVVNDSYGHDYGDEILIELANYLRTTIGEKGTIYRFGGDEFVLLIRHEYADSLDSILSEIRRRSDLPWKAMDQEFFCTLSIGIVLFADGKSDTRTSKEIIKHADIAMYEAKRQGKNKYEYYFDELDTSAVKRNEMERLLRDSMRNQFEGFAVHYQPILSAKTGKTQGAEALLRIIYGGSIIPPNAFLPLANYLGLIIPIGEFVLRRAAQQCKKLCDAGQEDVLMTINISSKQMNQNQFPVRFAQILKEEDVSPKNFAVSVSEGDATADYSQMSFLCDRLSRLGAQIVLDDYGGGKSSFTHLKSLPVNIVKISKVFMENLEDPFSKEYIKLTVQLCHSMGKSVCINGIETQAQYDFAKSCGADFLQGFYLSPATEPDDPSH